MVHDLNCPLQGNLHVGSHLTPDEEANFSKVSVGTRSAHVS
jgi:hypothetical protein